MVNRTSFFVITAQFWRLEQNSQEKFQRLFILIFVVFVSSFQDRRHHSYQCFCGIGRQFDAKKYQIVSKSPQKGFYRKCIFSNSCTRLVTLPENDIVGKYYKWRLSIFWANCKFWIDNKSSFSQSFLAVFFTRWIFELF